MTTLPVAVVVFVVAAGVVVVAGVRLAKAGDQIAERTGLGRLFIGTILLAFANIASRAGHRHHRGGNRGTRPRRRRPVWFVDGQHGDPRHHRPPSPRPCLASVELGHACVAAVAIVLTALAALGIHTPAGAMIGWVGVLSDVPVVFLEAGNLRNQADATLLTDSNFQEEWQMPSPRACRVPQRLSYEHFMRDAGAGVVCWRLIPAREDLAEAQLTRTDL